jgi:hypothetical protein
VALALTPALSPKKRERNARTFDDSPILAASADSVLFIMKRTERRPKDLRISRHKTRGINLPLLGERAGVRADVDVNSTAYGLIEPAGRFAFQI